MKQIRISIVVSILCALSLPGCAGGHDESIDGPDGDPRDNTSNGDADGSHSPAAPGAPSSMGNSDGGEGGGTAVDAGGGGGGDTGVNGQHIPEDVACVRLLAGQEAKIKSLGCFVTTRTCPSLVRAMTGVACADYDAGNVQACVASYDAASDCDGLVDAISACVLTVYPGASSAGCD